MVFFDCIGTSATALAQGYSPPVRPKIALIIGNWDYDENGSLTDKTKVPADRLSDLRNSCNDADRIESELIKLGWKEEDIRKKCNVKKRDMYDDIEWFTQSLLGSVEPLGFFYYAGHGVQVGDDAYIFGVDAQNDLDKSITVYRQNPNALLFKGGIRIRQEILANIGGTVGGSIFMVFDACRDNPIETGLKHRNIAAVSGPQLSGSAKLPGFKYLFSTSNGAPASDGAGAISPFAEVFAAQMSKEKNINSLTDSVVWEVFQKTQNTMLPQLPEAQGTLKPPPPDPCLGQC